VLAYIFVQPSARHTLNLPARLAIALAKRAGKAGLWWVKMPRKKRTKERYYV